MPATVKVTGLKELDRAWKNVDKNLQKQLRGELKTLAEPVAATSRSLGSRFGAKTAGGYVAGARTGGAVVRQRMRKTTGHHPEFGALQMATVLIPALDQHEDQIVNGVERLFDRIANREGF
jgi:hypothetical protein